MRNWQSLLVIVVYVLLAGCQTVPQDWGSAKDGLRTRLIPLSERYVIGKPMEFHLEMANVSESTIKYDDQQVSINNSLLIKGPDGEIVVYVYGGYQTAGRPEPIKPRETVTLLSRFDIASQYHIAKPGCYTIQHRGQRFGAGFGDLPIPPSNTVEIDVQPGELTAPDIIVGRLLEILPDKPGLERYVSGKWELTRRRSKSVTPEGRMKGKGINVELSINHTGYIGDTISVEIYQVDKPADLSSSEESIVSDYLGANQWGHVYVVIPPEAEKHWPDVREKISQALDIQHK